MAPRQPEGYTPTNLTTTIRQSPPVDLTKSYDPAWVKGKHIIVTGGASGFGAGFVQHWAQHGASVVVGDINVQKGEEVVAQLRQETKNDKIWFVACDVTNWDQQVNLFKEAVRLSPHGGIDVVVANAGIAGIEPLSRPADLSADSPKKPNFKVLDVNLYGVLYTAYCAMYWLPKNPGSKACSPDSDPTKQGEGRDRHLLLVGSVASLGPIVSQTLYGASKHGVLGVFRTLRASSFVEGIRVNAIFPYFIETPIMPAPARMLLAGAGVGKVEDVVDAGTRLVADSSILGRGLVIGPKATVKQDEQGEWVMVSKETEGATEKAVWEAYADDFEDSEAFVQSMTRILNSVTRIRGWVGWAKDVVGAVKYGMFG